jgi:hypothetical protein
MVWPRKGWLRSFDHAKPHILNDLCGVYRERSNARTLSVPRDQSVPHPRLSGHTVADESETITVTLTVSADTAVGEEYDGVTTDI